MKAAVYRGERRLVVEEIPTPSPGPGQVLVRVRYCAICGTDVHAYMYDAPPPGTVMGHEYCGTIAAVGAGVTRWSEGDRVVGGGGMAPAGSLPSFKGARFNYRTMGFDAKPVRAYAEYVLMEEWEPLGVPDGVSDEDAALCEPLAVAVHAVRRSALRLGDSVAVLGGGPIGLFTAQAARAAGASRVILSEPAPARARAALELGADAVVDPTSGDAVEEVLAHTNGLGPDVVFDCAGAPPTLDQAMNMVRREGQVMLVALAWEPTPLLPVDWIAREISLATTFSSSSEDWLIAFDLLGSGRARTGPMLSESSFIPLDDIQQAFDDLMQPTTQLQMIVSIP